MRAVEQKQKNQNLDEKINAEAFYCPGGHSRSKAACSLMSARAFILQEGN